MTTSDTATDIRQTFTEAVSTGGEVIAGVQPGQLRAPTPCPDFDVRRMMDHLVAVLQKVAAMGRGQSPMRPDVELADGEWTRAWSEAAADTRDVWADDAVLARTVRLPWTEMTGTDTLAIYTSEIVVHTWDLAVSTGQSPRWGQGVLETAFEAISRELPAEGRAAVIEEALERMQPGVPLSPPFADAVPVPADAPLIVRLVAWTGRQPEESPAATA
jgi:uncharacterized protein (TIGR03086 family)